MNPIGIMVDSLRLGVRDGLKKAKELGADGVQIYAVSGEMDPANLSSGARKDLKDFIASLGLEISALCGDLGGHGFQDASVNAAKIEKSKRILDLAVELGTKVVTTHIGVVPEQENDPIYETMHRACEELGVYAKSLDAYFAIETGPETAVHLKGFLDTLSTNGVSVNFDPANMVMVTGDDPVQGIITLKDYIVHTHVKDGIRLRQADPREVYGSLGYKPMSHEQIAEAATSGPYYRELALGEGHVDFTRYFQALRDIGYKGYLTIEREVGEQPEKDIASAIAFIRKYQ
ncbi:sugar phosphate isomerase/epimerase family protein [Paenibacillus aceris]|uniref:Sugar phosphate isomerase/epimerase n=1 Tax=Paenibacillus aceris TaxID=869555 RepID=A0ABS4HXQ2_9BACL|nr:sugar phosphate isomerase/epimerase family protein [Paenibacillus aceris]MBP1962709.1 sugar phosphate isomerase/epimerase [Paenibacillus aceris]NHW33929.1 sugar phosphate isomerase/epimerase [Paenibacillus aceris]